MKRTRQTIKAGKKGTQKYLDKYGSDLLYVRYYYDLEKHRRITTVELVMDEKKWVPKKIHPNKIVRVKVEWGETAIARRIKELGGKWNKEGKVWEIAFGKVKAIGIQSRIVRK